MSLEDMALAAAWYDSSYQDEAVAKECAAFRQQLDLWVKTVEAPEIASQGGVSSRLCACLSVTS